MNQQNSPNPVLSGRAIILFVVAFLASAIIWPLSLVTPFTSMDLLWVFVISMVIATCAQVMLVFRYSAAPSPPRYYANLAFIIYLFSGIVLWVWGVLIVDIAATEMAALQNIALFIPRLLLASVLLLSTIALWYGERDQGVGNRAYSGWVWVGVALLIIFTFIFSFAFAIPKAFSFGVVNQAWEILPLSLFLTSLFISLRRGVWLTHKFAYGMVWLYLLESIASLYLLFAHAAGTSFGIAGLMAHMFALAAPLCTMQIQMFDLYRSSEQYRLKKHEPQFGSQGVQKKTGSGCLS